MYAVTLHVNTLTGLTVHTHTPSQTRKRSHTLVLFTRAWNEAHAHANAMHMSDTTTGLLGVAVTVAVPPHGQATESH